jgi:2,4-dienoyl-CoA reductase-like NADH-dependent reductase (Old Yellow Enzyme family)
MTDEDLAEVKAQFVATTERALRIGFDLLELHGAHGYLLHEFLSPISNRREDAYGGSLENRMRFPLEVFEAVRRAWPDDKPLGMRVSATDYVEGGWTVEDTVALATELKALGCDFVDVSGGGLDPRQEIPLGPGYQVPLAERVRREAGIATWAVGMITRARQAEAIVADGQADMVALARAMMFDPRWAWRAALDSAPRRPIRACTSAATRRLGRAPR